jgi:hypothetical protein
MSWRAFVEDAMRLTLSAGEPVRSRSSIFVGIPEDSEIRQLQGEGVDGVGPFVISGWAWSTGEVTFRKQYIEQHSWEYSGQILPWGIAGSYNQGPFWIWRVAN